MYLILPARDLGHDLPIGVQQIRERAQVPAHWIEQRGPAQLGRHHDQRPVGDDVVGERAALGELPVGVDVDTFSQPLVDARAQRRRGKQFVNLGKG